MTTEHKPNILNKLVYTVFVITGIVFIFLKDFSSATIFIGISLSFDPFDQKMPFGKRPLWQRIWLIIHLIATFVLLWFTVKS